jgi:hypothetical protein
MKSPPRNCVRRLRCALILPGIARKPSTPPSISRSTASLVDEPSSGGLSAADDPAVTTAMFAEAAWTPSSVTELGVIVHVDWGGAPLQASATA